MRFITYVSCQIWFIHVALQCYQARLEPSDQGYRDVEPLYRELNEESDVKNTVSLRNLPNSESKDVEKVEMEFEGKTVLREKQDEPEILKDSEEKGINGQHRQAKSEDRRAPRKRNHFRLKQEHKEDLGVENSPNEENISDNLGTGHFYLAKFSDTANTSAMLGPGPVSIQIFDQTTPKPKTSQNIGNVTKLGVRKVGNLSIEDSHLVSFVGEHKFENSIGLKLHSGIKQAKNKISNRNDNLIPVKERRKKSRRTFNKKVRIRPDERENTDQIVGHKRRKHKHIYNEAVNTKKDTEKYHMNEEEKYTNLSAINKGFQRAASRKFAKHIFDSPIDDESTLDDEDPGEHTKMTVRKICDEDNEMSEEHKSIGDETSEVESKNDNMNPRNNPRKGIRSKIEHGDWLNQVTLLPLPDYSVRRNLTYNKKKLALAGGQNKSSEDSYIGEKKRHKIYKRKKSLDLNNSNSKFVQTSKESNNDWSQYVSDMSLESPGETENKRNERDIITRGSRQDSNIPKENIFKHRSETDYSNANADDMYEGEFKHEGKSHSNFNSKIKNTNGNQDIFEKAEDDYEYDSRLNENERCIEQVEIVNRTIQSTTCAPATETVQSTKYTMRKGNQPKSTPKTNDKLETTITSGNDVDKRNKSIDPYEMFLCGTLADDFVDEVFKKVKTSRKISRELGFSNETEETCDRCIELKTTIIPELAVMRNSLGQCVKSYNHVQNCSLCCSIPKVMARYLGTLVSFGKENENNLYNKIQDDSSFIFTGDYTELTSKEGNDVKVKDKYLDERSSIHNEELDKQHLKEDLNEENNHDKIEISDSVAISKGKLSTEDEASDGTIIGSGDTKINKVSQSGIKRYLRRFGKSKIDENSDGTLGFTEHLKQEDFAPELHFRDSATLVKDYDSEKGSDSSIYTTREFGKSRQVFGDRKKDNIKNPLNALQDPDRTGVGNFERYYGKGNYDHFKLYPQKNLLSKAHPSYKLNYGDSSKNTLANYNKDRSRLYKFPNTNTMLNSVDNLLTMKDKYLGFPQSKYNNDDKINPNENYKGFESKYEDFYENNGEYSLYPNIEGRYREEENRPRMCERYQFNDGDSARSRRYQLNDGDSTRMVKRDAESLTGYDDEPNVFFEIPDIEYDLYK